MKFADKYYGKSTADIPCPLVSDLLKMEVPDMAEAFSGLDFATCAELKSAWRRAWWSIANDIYLNSRETQKRIPTAANLLAKARKTVTAANGDKVMDATAEGLWLQKFERNALETRIKAAFAGNMDYDAYETAKTEISAVYGFPADVVEMLRYFVCQARRGDADPALNRALYLYSKEKMTGKTTVARIIAGILNGRMSWRECQGGEAFSDIATELQFGTFDRPKATRCQCVVMDEAFTGKGTGKYYGKFKMALTCDTAAVQVKFGGTYDVRCTRNYVFTSNDEAASIIADESERRLFVIEMRKPKERTYEELFTMWRDFIVNAPAEDDTARWYRATMQPVRGEAGVMKEDFKSAFLSPDFLNAVTEYRDNISRGVLSDLNSGETACVGKKYQLPFPKFFTDFLSRSYDVRRHAGLVKESVTEVFGQPKGKSRKYYNVVEVIAALNVGISAEEYEQDNGNDTGGDLPF